MKIDLPLRVCSYEDRSYAMDGLILMGESLCRADAEVSLHLTVPDAPEPVRAWAASRPNVVLSIKRLEGVTGWDVKPSLLLEELNAGHEEALWLDSDMIINRSISQLVNDFPKGMLLVAEEWDRVDAAGAAHLWRVPFVRPIAPLNSCFVRVTTAHRLLLERWLEKTREQEYRKEQTLPFKQRAFCLASDQVLLTALLGGGEFCKMPFDIIRLGAHIEHCAGTAAYSPGDRLRDLFRGLPAMIHCIGRKPWTPVVDESGVQRFGADLASDVSAYVLAARRLARETNMNPDWIKTRTFPGGIFRWLTGFHPAMAGLPMAIAHSLYQKLSGHKR